MRFRLQRFVRDAAGSLLRPPPRTDRTARRHHRRRRRRTLVVLAGLGAVAPLVLLVMAAAMVISLLGPISQSEFDASADPCTDLGGPSGMGSGSGVGQANQPGGPGGVNGLDDEQMKNAQLIIKAGKANKIPPYGWVIALATARQESTLRNVGHGDDVGPDSRGLFQQRAPWGPEANRMNPEKAATYFYMGGEGGQNGLTDIPNWEQRPIGEAAQAVQRSGDPSGTWYAQHEALARALVEELGDTPYEPNDCGGEAPMQCPQSPFPDAEEGLTPDGQLVMRCAAKQFPEFESMLGVGQRAPGGDGDHAAGRAVDMMVPGDYKDPKNKALGWKAAEWIQKNHASLGVKYIIFDKKIWSVARNDEGWRDYENYSGCTSDTCLHYDHVHVSVYGDAARSPVPGATTWVLPVEAGQYTLTARFGECGGNWGNCHTGLDFAAPTGTPIHAAAGGKVTFAGQNGPYGNRVIIDHGGGVTTTYSHMSNFAGGVDGATVKSGMVIGYVGSTGNSTGPHLHFEVKRGDDFQDPERWLSGHGVDP